MNIEFKENTLIVSKSYQQERYYSESTLLHHVKAKLILHGHDVIKKRAWKDGNLVADEMQYIRSRKPRKGERSFYIYDNLYNVRDLAKEFNNVGKVVLLVVWDIF